MPADTPNTEELLRRSNAGDGQARQSLLIRYQGRLRDMIRIRMDRRLLGRLDPSDVVQEVLVEAHQKLDAYLRDRPLPFYLWLREMAWQRLIKVYEHHQAQKRSVRREQQGVFDLPDDSATALAARLVVPGPSPTGEAMREEQQQRVHEALQRLRPNDREVLVLRYLEQLSTRETATVLGISEGTVKTRHARALVRLQTLLGDEEERVP